MAAVCVHVKVLEMEVGVEGQLGAQDAWPKMPERLAIQGEGAKLDGGAGEPREAGVGGRGQEVGEAVGEEVGFVVERAAPTDQGGQRQDVAWFGLLSPGSSGCHDCQDSRLQDELWIRLTARHGHLPLHFHLRDVMNHAESDTLRSPNTAPGS